MSKGEIKKRKRCTEEKEERRGVRDEAGSKVDEKRREQK